MAPIFKDVKLIEAWGNGIQKMREELKAYPEIDLVLLEAGHAFQVQFNKKELPRTKQALSRHQVEGRVRAESRPSGGRVTAGSIE